MKNKLLTSGIALLILAGCSTGAKLGNVSIPGSASDVANNELGRNKQLRYTVSGNMDSACADQFALATAANFKTTEEPTKEDMHMKNTFNDGTNDLVIVCTEQKDGDKLIGTRVTLTMMAN